MGCDSTTLLGFFGRVMRDVSPQSRTMSAGKPESCGQPKSICSRIQGKRGSRHTTLSYDRVSRTTSFIPKQDTDLLLVSQDKNVCLFTITALLSIETYIERGRREFIKGNSIFFTFCTKRLGGIDPALASLSKTIRPLQL